MDSGCAVVMTTQCIFGGVNMNVYDKGRDLMGLGIISGRDMLYQYRFSEIVMAACKLPA